MKCRQLLTQKLTSERRNHPAEKSAARSTSAPRPSINRLVGNWRLRHFDLHLCAQLAIVATCVPPASSASVVPRTRSHSDATADVPMTRQTIVLAHGILGFGALPLLPSPVNYFNGVAEHLRRQGHAVFAPHVNPIGSIAQRGDQLAAAILDVPLSEGEQLHVIAHSMGGLDARHALANVDGVAARVKTLVTIGTPHRGSPVADAVDNPAHPLFDQIPQLLADVLHRTRVPCMI